MGDKPQVVPVSVLEAFLTTYETARSNFGGDTLLQPGTPLFESGAAVGAVASDMARSIPGDAWTGTASDAYAEANNENTTKMRAFAALDKRLGSQIDAAAYSVSRGRQDLVTVHDQVISLADSVPPGPLREVMLMPIVAAGMGQIGDIVSRTAADLSDISKDITEIADEYQKLAGDQGFGTCDEDPREKLDDILREYQVEEDWKPMPTGLLDLIRKFGDRGKDIAGHADLTAGEYALVAELGATQGPMAVWDFFDIKSAAEEEAINRFPPPAPLATSDNRTDAFRHTYWNALMTQRFGEEWTRQFATAHERRPGEPAPREAMDLYNNEIGRQIGMTHPNASTEELADLVGSAVRNGDTVIVSMDGRGLEWSSNTQALPMGAHGGNPDAPADGGPPVKFPPGHPTPYPTEGRTPGIPA
ncbi:hypothetical protein A5755_05945 [Mycolicibacterium fortuitum]|nr:hypothetical protein A5763_27395 [Mycolicibacterium fortuitum]OBB44161.1 hypothetical protein A5754_00575 [Mycolicibacterium fortuitum]OBB80578.1 hypothetical protein A5755_05945 [Mycolicibacterium fortuitum]OBF67567.1 hypothetical protein A5751_01900 [Mycolicibacterium fortuitum]OBG09192.1 hypothetical protein A5768_15655 [Mycolicibacterium fortuitum]